MQQTVSWQLSEIYIFIMFHKILQDLDIYKVKNDKITWTAGDLTIRDAMAGVENDRILKLVILTLRTGDRSSSSTVKAV